MWSTVEYPQLREKFRVGDAGASALTVSRRELPVTPGHDAVGRPGAVREHGDVLEQMAIGIAEVDRRGGHPGEDDRFVRRLLLKVERRDAE